MSTMRAYEAELRPDVAPHASVVDARRLDIVELGAFNTMAAYLAKRWGTFSQVVSHQAVLRPGGLTGAAVAGFYAVLGPTYPVQVFADPVLALSWLGTSDHFWLLGELERIYLEASGSSQLLVTLRLQLERWPRTTLADCANLFGLSQRTFQRRLSELGTTFQSELNHAQVRVAQQLILQSDYPLKQIALEVGCASLQHFSTVFRKLTGEAPSSWRARRAALEG